MKIITKTHHIKTTNKTIKNHQENLDNHIKLKLN